MKDKHRFKPRQKVTIIRGSWAGLKAKIIERPLCIENKPLGRYALVSDYGKSDTDLYEIEDNIAIRQTGQCKHCLFWQYDYLKDVCKNLYCDNYKKHTEESDSCDSFAQRSEHE